MQARLPLGYPWATLRLQSLAKAEILKAEMLKPAKPHQCDIKATSKRVDSQLIGTPKPP
jgi:hypothetical protein